MNRNLMLIVVIGLLMSSSYFVLSDPQGVTIVSNSTETKNATPATSLTTAGGSFTTLVLNGTFQNSRWKAFVGNISGALTLDDSSNSTIYDWDLAVVTGEVYASRSNNVNWGLVDCLDDTRLSTEETALSITTSKEDSINSTFNDTIHSSFLVAGNAITNSTCRAIATYVNDAAQAPTEDANFQEVLLDDNTNVIYTSLLEQDQTGYDSGSTFDFQMIVPDEETAGVDTTYYFYAELG